MRTFTILTLPLLLGAPALRSQSLPLAYRGFVLAAPYGEFTARARLLAEPQTTPLVCNTSRRTAQLMECGAPIRDPADSARFYLAAYVLEGQVAFLSFGDSGSAPLVERLQRDLEGAVREAPRLPRGDVGVAVGSRRSCGSRGGGVGRPVGSTSPSGTSLS